jgi:hypothetical protein
MVARRCFDLSTHVQGRMANNGVRRSGAADQAVARLG